MNFHQEQLKYLPESTNNNLISTCNQLEEDKSQYLNVIHQLQQTNHQLEQDNNQLKRVNCKFKQKIHKIQQITNKF
jgi:hypothetical protein